MWTLDTWEQLHKKLQFLLCNEDFCSPKGWMYWISTVCWSAQQPIICNYCHQTTKPPQVVGIYSTSKTHIQINKAQRTNQLGPVPFLSLPPSAIPGCLPTADNGCAPLRPLYWDDGWGHLPHSRLCLLRPHANVCSPLKRINGNSYKW